MNEGKKRRKEERNQMLIRWSCLKEKVRVRELLVRLEQASGRRTSAAAGLAACVCVCDDDDGAEMVREWKWLLRALTLAANRERGEESGREGAAARPFSCSPALPAAAAGGATSAAPFSSPSSFCRLFQFPSCTGLEYTASLRSVQPVYISLLPCVRASPPLPPASASLSTVPVS